eukprot:Rmarinus@m.15448
MMAAVPDTRRRAAGRPTPHPGSPRLRLGSPRLHRHALGPGASTQGRDQSSPDRAAAGPGERKRRVRGLVQPRAGVLRDATAAAAASRPARGSDRDRDRRLGEIRLGAALEARRVGVSGPGAAAGATADSPVDYEATLLDQPRKLMNSLRQESHAVPERHVPSSSPGAALRARRHATLVGKGARSDDFIVPEVDSRSALWCVDPRTLENTTPTDQLNPVLHSVLLANRNIPRHPSGQRKAEMDDSYWGRLKRYLLQ